MVLIYQSHVNISDIQNKIIDGLDTLFKKIFEAEFWQKIDQHSNVINNNIQSKLTKVSNKLKENDNYKLLVGSCKQKYEDIKGREDFNNVQAIISPTFESMSECIDSLLAKPYDKYGKYCYIVIILISCYVLYSFFSRFSKLTFGFIINVLFLNLVIGLAFMFYNGEICNKLHFILLLIALYTLCLSLSYLVTMWFKVLKFTFQDLPKRVKTKSDEVVDDKLCLYTFLENMKLVIINYEPDKDVICEDFNRFVQLSKRLETLLERAEYQTISEYKFELELYYIFQRTSELSSVFIRLTSTPFERFKYLCRRIPFIEKLLTFLVLFGFSYGIYIFNTGL